MGLLTQHGTERGIRVLLIDDNPSWAETAVKLLDDTDDGITVEIATDEAEARSRLNTDSFDCVVSDYSMPRLTGLELIKQIKRTRSELPCILITSQGDEQIASQAISSGADDYLTKSDATERPSLFANRIRNVVSSSRTRKALEKRNEWYESIAETVPEAICLYEGGDLIYVNDQFCDLVGQTETQLRDSDPSDYVHETDIERYRSMVSGSTVIEAEFRLTDRFGDVRQCLVTANQITAGELPTMACVIRDVTAQRQRERAMRQELEVKETVWDILVRNSTKTDIAQQACERLVDQTSEYDLGVVVSNSSRLDTDEGVEALASVGAPTEYLPALEDASAGCQREAPVLRALENRRPAAVSADDETDDWDTFAGEYDIQSAVAVPIEHDQISYGALGVYSTSARDIDPQHRPLETLGETLGYAFSAVEIRESLVADAARHARVELTDSESALVALGDEISVASASMDVTTLLTSDGMNQLYGETPLSVETIETAADACDRVHSHDVEAAPSGGSQVYVELEQPCLGATLLEVGAQLDSVALQDRGVEFTAHLSDGTETGELIDLLSERFDGVTLMASGPVEQQSPSRPELLEPLTDRQLEVLEVAYHRGYFKQPKEASAKEVAEDLDIGRTTFTQHLRAAQRKLLSTIIDSENEIQPVNR